MASMTVRGSAVRGVAAALLAPPAAAAVRGAGAPALAAIVTAIAESTYGICGPVRRAVNLDMSSVRRRGMAAACLGRTCPGC